MKRTTIVITVPWPFTVRDAAHFMVAFAGAFALAIIGFGGTLDTGALAGLALGALQVAFRQMAPNPPRVTPSDAVPVPVQQPDPPQ